MTTALLLLVCAIALAAQSAQALPHPLLDLYDNQSPDSITEETEQVAEMDANEISAFETEVLDTQAVTITNCGLAGSIVQAALQFGLSFVPNSNIVTVSVNCALRVNSYVCTDVVVLIRGTRYTSVRACRATSKFTLYSVYNPWKSNYSFLFCRWQRVCACDRCSQVSTPRGDPSYSNLYSSSGQQRARNLEIGLVG